MKAVLEVTICDLKFSPLTPNCEIYFTFLNKRAMNELGVLNKGV